MSTFQVPSNPFSEINENDFNFEEQEVLETDPPVLRAEIDDNPEPELFEPIPENYSEEEGEESGYEADDESE